MVPRLLKADGMPTVLNIPGPYRLFFYSFDCHEPPHVHVRRERMVCKFWLAPVAFNTNPWLFPPRTESYPGHYSGAFGAHLGGMV